MNGLTVGARVRAAISPNQPCSLHRLDAIPVLGAIGTVDLIHDRLGEHYVVVAFGLWHFGTRWTDRFMPSELMPA